MTPRSSAGVLLFLALMAPSCVIVDDSPDYEYVVVPEPYVPADVVVARMPIDSGALIDVAPGVGAGFFIEHDSDGLWRLFSTCDTEESNLACEWDVVASIPRALDLDLVSDDDLDPEDTVIRIDEGAIRMWALTDYDFDGISIQAPDAEPVRFDVLLDGFPAPEFVHWIGDGVLNESAPSSPFELEPAPRP